MQRRHANNIICANIAQAAEECVAMSRNSQIARLAGKLFQECGRRRGEG